MFEMHRDANGNELPIAAMDDQHLTNTVKMRCRSISQFLASCATITDPAQAALYGIKARSPEAAGEEARKVAVKLYPYLSEALLRGGQPAAECANAIRNAIGRHEAFYVSAPSMLPTTNTHDQNEAF